MGSKICTVLVKDLANTMTFISSQWIIYEDMMLKRFACLKTKWLYVTTVDNIHQTKMYKNPIYQSYRIFKKSRNIQISKMDIRLPWQPWLRMTKLRKHKFIQDTQLNHICENDEIP